MTSTTAHSTFSHSISQRCYPHAFDRLVAALGLSMLRWAQARNSRRALTHESHGELRALEADRADRELAAQRTAAMRGF